MSNAFVDVVSGEQVLGVKVVVLRDQVNLGIAVSVVGVGFARFTGQFHTIKSSVSYLHYYFQD